MAYGRHESCNATNASWSRAIKAPSSSIHSSCSEHLIQKWYGIVCQVTYRIQYRKPKVVTSDALARAIRNACMHFDWRFNRVEGCQPGYPAQVALGPSPSIGASLTSPKEPHTFNPILRAVRVSQTPQAFRKRGRCFVVCCTLHLKFVTLKALVAFEYMARN